MKALAIAAPCLNNIQISTAKSYKPPSNNKRQTGTMMAKVCKVTVCLFTNYKYEDAGRNKAEK